MKRALFTDVWMREALAWSSDDQMSASPTYCRWHGHLLPRPRMALDWEWVRLAQRYAWHYGAEGALTRLQALPAAPSTPRDVGPPNKRPAVLG